MRFASPFERPFPIVALLIICLVSACTTPQFTDYSPRALRSTLEVGDFVEITTKDGDEYNFRITDISFDEIEGEGISGGEYTVTLEDIEEIEATRMTEAGEVISVIGGVVVIGATIWYTIILPILAIVSLASWGS